MIALLKYLWKLLPGIGLLFIVFYYFARVNYQAGYDSANSAWQLKDERRKKNDAIQMARQQVAVRLEEERQRDEAIKTKKYADQHIAEARADAVLAQSASDRLHTTITTLRRQLAASEAGKLSATTAASATRANTLILFANVLESADKRAGELAEYADRARIAGQTCEKLYASATQNKK